MVMLGRPSISSFAKTLFTIPSMPFSAPLSFSSNKSFQMWRRTGFSNWSILSVFCQITNQCFQIRNILSPGNQQFRSKMAKKFQAQVLTRVESANERSLRATVDVLHPVPEGELGRVWVEGGQRDAASLRRRRQRQHVVRVRPRVSAGEDKCVLIKQ